MDAQQISEEMAAQRAGELAGDEQQYKLRKACSARAVELFQEMKWMRLEIAGISSRPSEYTISKIDQLITEIEIEAQ